MKTKTDQIKIKPLFRQVQAEVVRDDSDKQTRTVELSFSSSNPIERYFGLETLDHSKGSVRLDRLNTGAPLLLNHDPDKQVGVIERAELKNGKGRAVVRFSNSQLGNEIFTDVSDGIRTLVSVGYRVHSMKLEKTSDEGDEFRIDDWEPFEVSMVSIPADTSVGVGRSTDLQENICKRTLPMKEEKTLNEPTPKIEASPKIDIGRERQSAVDAECSRRDKISDLGEHTDTRELADQAIKGRTSFEEFKEIVLREKFQAKPVEEVSAVSAEVGMSDKQSREYSIVAGIQDFIKNGRSTGIFAEASAQVSRNIGQQPAGFFIPGEVFGKRDLTDGTATAGGHTVGTDIATPMIDLLRKKQITTVLGATQMNGLVGNVAIPRHTTAGTAYWVAENAAITESSQAFDQVTLAPNRLGAYTDISKQLIAQSSIGVESFVRNDLTTVLATELDRAALVGSGSGSEPTGIITTSGIGDVVGGTNGAAPDWADCVNIPKEVGIDNAIMGNLAFVTSAAGMSKMKTVSKESGQAIYLWQDGSSYGEGSVAGYRAYVSNQVPSNIAKGSGTNLTYLMFGNWSDLIIAGWDGVDIVVDPFTLATTGLIRITISIFADIAVRHAESFSAMKDLDPA